MSDRWYTAFSYHIDDFQSCFVLQIFHNRCTLLFLTRLWKCVVSSLYIRFLNNVDLSTSSLFLSTQSTNHWKVLSARPTTLFPVRVPLLPKCFWVKTAFLSWRVSIIQAGRTLLRQRIGRFSELFSRELLAQFHDRLWDYLSLHSSWVQGLMMIVARPRKSSQLSLICLPLGFVIWLHRHSLSILSNWIHLCWGSLWLSGKFQSLLGVLWLTWGSYPCKSFARHLWQDLRRLYRSPLA